jgi:chemotaxis protein methyltransferase CheR
VDVSPASQRILASLLETRTGQQLALGRRWRVDTALAPIMRRDGFDSVEQLVARLVSGADPKLTQNVIEALLNNETYFFRDHAYFATLERTVLPDLARERAATRRLRIWSAGCSTGQEALSLAMLFAEQPARWAGWTIDILGTDVSGKAIASARGGIYSQFEIQRGISVAQMLNFFTATDDGWQASDRIRQMIRFQQHNVLDAVPASEPFDLVLCRNVMLYFDIATRKRVFDRIAGALGPGGWLMLGAGETVAGQTHRFEPAGCGSSLYRPLDGRPAERQRLAAAGS